MVRSKGPRPLAALLLALSTACEPAHRCPVLEHCDVRQSACQRSALAQAACLRGRDEASDELPPVRVRELSDYLDELAAEARRDDDALAMRHALGLLGLVPSDGDDPAAAARSTGALAAAYYDGEAGEVVLLRRPGRRFDDGHALLTLVHEMVHVLQARAGELDAPAPQRLDPALASAAVREGEATLLADEAYVTGVGLELDHIGYDDTLYAYGANQFQYARRARYAFDELPMRFPYAEGARYLRPTRTGAGAYDTASAFASPPASTRDVLAGDPGEPARYPNDLADAAVPALDGLTLVGTLHLGAYAHAVIGQRYRGAWFGWALPEASAFRADTLAVFRDERGAILASWRVRYRDADTASATADALARYLATSAPDDLALRASVVDGALWLVLADDAALLASVPDAPDFSAAPAADFDFGASSPGSLRCMVGSE